MQVAARAQGLHLVDEAGRQHRVEARGDALVQPGAVGGLERTAARSAGSAARRAVPRA